jgi:hypothetical protein
MRGSEQRWLSPIRIFAEIRLLEHRRHPFTAPYFVSGTLWVVSKKPISIFEIPINSGLTDIDGLIIAVVKKCS